MKTIIEYCSSDCESLFHAVPLRPSVERHILAVHCPITTAEHRHRSRNSVWKKQHHGKQFPNQTYQVLTLFWGDQIHVHPKKRNECICEHINYLIFQDESINSLLTGVWTLQNSVSVHHLFSKSSKSTSNCFIKHSPNKSCQSVKTF